MILVNTQVRFSAFPQPPFQLGFWASCSVSLGINKYLPESAAEGQTHCRGEAAFSGVLGPQVLDCSVASNANSYVNRSMNLAESSELALTNRQLVQRLDGVKNVGLTACTSLLSGIMDITSWQPGLLSDAFKSSSLLPFFRFTNLC